MFCRYHELIFSVYSAWENAIEAASSQHHGWSYLLLLWSGTHSNWNSSVSVSDWRLTHKCSTLELSGLQLYIRQYSDPERVVNFIASQLRHMNSQIMENVIQYYLHVYDSALRIYSQKKSEYRTANYLYCGEIKSIFAAGN